MTRDGQLCGQEVRLQEAEDRFIDVVETSFSTLVGQRLQEAEDRFVGVVETSFSTLMV